MQITLKIHGGRELPFEVHPELGVNDLKILVECETDIAAAEMRILHKGRALHDDDTLQAAGARRDFISQFARRSERENKILTVCRLPYLRQQASTTATSFTSRSTLARRSTSIRARSCRSPARSLRARTIRSLR